MKDRDMTEENLPFNLVGSAEESDSDVAETEEETLAADLPQEKVTFRWRYANKKIQLYERRLRSLRAYGVGPALQAWIRARMEWVSDNKLYAQPEGVIVLDIDPEGDVKIELEGVGSTPSFVDEDLIWDGESLAGVRLEGTLWAVTETDLVAVTEQVRSAADTFVRDLAHTLGREVVEGASNLTVSESLEVFLVNDEHGIVVCEGRAGEVTGKLRGCFDKLWSVE